MTGIDEKALNEKLAKWAGFRWETHPLTHDALIAPDGKFYGHYQTNPPDFTTSLDASFRWLVPLALARLRIIYTCELDEAEKRLMGRWLGERDDNHQLGWTTALSLAIEKLIPPSG